MKAMILAAGLGTRLKPFTEKHPKALAVVNGKPLLQRNIEYLASFGVNEITVNVHHFADQIVDFIHSHSLPGVTVHISDEADEVLETGGGLMRASKYLMGNEPFFLLNVDVLTDLDLLKMLQQHTSTGALATLAVTRRNTSRYFLFDENDRLCGWQNIKTGEQRTVIESLKYIPRAFSGIHIIDPEIFSLVKQKGKFSMVDVYLDLANSRGIFGYDHTGGKFMDVGTTEKLVKAAEMFY